jgi:Ni,Fe-hydrogenase III small subunit
MKIRKLFRVNSGSCGGCDVELASAVAASHDLTWTDNPFDADALLLTGPLAVGSRAAFQALWRELDGGVRLLAIGRCAIDGSPFGRGGVVEIPEVGVRLKLDGCPPTPEAMAAAIREAVTG